MSRKIEQNVRQVLSELPEGVHLVVAAKVTEPEVILQAIAGGARIIGENYVQEAERAYQVVGDRVRWHFIGHLQKNKVKKAMGIFDMIETVDSVAIAREIDKWCAQSGKIMPVLVEVNIGREAQKPGVLPENVEPLLREISGLANIRVQGLMTLGPAGAAPEDSRPYFAGMKKLLDRIESLGLANVEMRYLSMGMTGSYQVALGEGANIVRLGSRVFNPCSREGLGLT
ncbi:MAG: YggS family pyridoxal phosphate-dependent enzyme [Dehalococcoidales bacterium]|nr:YggS family pyridoxal phosphate-dependent enzyme [Dehalococcoidales bacterium]